MGYLAIRKAFDAFHATDIFCFIPEWIDLVEFNIVHKLIKVAQDVIAAADFSGVIHTVAARERPGGGGSVHGTPKGLGGGVRGEPLGIRGWWDKGLSGRKWLWGWEWLAGCKGLMLVRSVANVGAVRVLGRWTTEKA